MAIFFTSDTHFSHFNIIQYATRPFDDIDQMNAEIIRRWNTVVGEDDTVYHLGDVAMGKLEISLAHVTRLNGHKILVAGNHDKCWIGDRAYRKGTDAQVIALRLQKNRKLYFNAGFSEIINSPDVNGKTLELTLSTGLKVAVSHFPYQGDSQDQDRYTQWRPKDEGLPLITGHVHGKWLQRGKMLNVGIDQWNGYPVPEEKVSQMLSTPSDIYLTDAQRWKAE